MNSYLAVLYNLLFCLLLATIYIKVRIKVKVLSLVYVMNVFENNFKKYKTQLGKKIICPWDSILKYLIQYDKLYFYSGPFNNLIGRVYHCLNFVIKSK